MWSSVLGCASVLGLPERDAWRGGERRAAVILMSWQDRPPTWTREEVERAFFAPDELSLARWFDENAHDAFSLDGEVFDWVEAPARWADMDPRDPSAILALAEQLVELDVEAFDAGGNGRIDHLFVVHSGVLDRPRPKPVYAFPPEHEHDFVAVLQSRGIGDVGTELPIGWYLHEGAHEYLGFGDRYGKHTEGSYGIGIWGLMGLGQWGPSNRIASDDLFRYPTHLRASRKARLGWVDVRWPRKGREFRLEPVESSGEVARVGDYWLEVRGKTGFSEGLPGHGLLIWHEHTGWFDERRVSRLVQADGRDDLEHGTAQHERPVPPIDENFGDAGDPFPGADRVSRFEGEGVVIEGIRLDGEAVVFTVR